MKNSIPKAYKYIGSMLNVAYLTGFVREVDKVARTFKLQQTSNTEHSLTIHVPKDARIPSNQEPVTVKAHIYGNIVNAPVDPALATQDPQAEKQPAKQIREAEIRAFEIVQPNKLSMPTHVAWFGLGAGKGKTTILPKGMKRDTTGFNPFSEDAELTQEVAQKLDDGAKDGAIAEMEQVIRDIIDATEGRIDSKLGKNSNVVFVAGMIQDIVIVPKNQYRKHEYISMLVRQHKDPDQCIPVRIEPDSSLPLSEFVKDAKKGFPVKVVGQMRVKIIQNEAGDVIGHTCYLRCHQLLTPFLLKDIKFFPPWWKEFAETLQAGKQARRERLEALAKNNGADADTADVREPVPPSSAKAKADELQIIGDLPA